jgi:hypothetical protein
MNSVDNPYFLMEDTDLRRRIEELKDHLASMAGLWAKSDSEKQLLLGRIEELEALYAAAKRDAQEAEAYAEALEAKLYDIAQDELKGQSHGPWPNAIRAVNYRVGTNEDSSPIWAHRIEQYHDGQWTAIRVYNESEDGTLEEEDQ